MTLIDEILKKEKDILQRSSVREKLFYSFLTGKEKDTTISIPDGEIDKVCYAAFTDSQIDISKELQRSLNAAPIRGLHFSNNLLSLIAFSIKSQDAKSKFLNEYFNSNSLVYQFILNKIFHTPALPNNPKVVSDFDKLIDEIFIKRNYGYGEQLLFMAYEKANDLIELFIVREAYQEILKIHPNTETGNLLRELALSSQKIIDASKKRIDSYVNVTILSIAFALIVGLPYLINKKWAAWDLEPYITGIQISIGVFWFVVMVLFNTNPNWFKVVQNFKSWLLRAYFERKKVDIARLNQIIEKADIIPHKNTTNKKENFFSKLNWRILLSGLALLVGITTYWYFDIGHKPVENVNILIGNNYDFAKKLYFRSNPDEFHTFKLKDAKNEFRGIIQSHASILKDSTIHEYTWSFSRYNVTIWVGKTASLDHQVIDAIRWRKDVQF
ncbi:MAG: hypothetical protein IT234_00775 [Bacteroidia bacterium]|nr:hypothetical protein [Bacteroidia bacterium]